MSGPSYVWTRLLRCAALLGARRRTRERQDTRKDSARGKTAHAEKQGTRETGAAIGTMTQVTPPTRTTRCAMRRSTRTTSRGRRAALAAVSGLAVVLTATACADGADSADRAGSADSAHSAQTAGAPASGT